MKNPLSFRSDIVLRRAGELDRMQLLEVESKSTPKLRYLSSVFETFASDEIGEFCVAEIDRKLVACGKFTVMPDGSAWLETLRVVPAYQKMGIGKRIYERFFDLALARNISTMRMYTGLNNATSKGLAERFGFHLAATYRGAWLPCHAEATEGPSHPFRQVADPAEARSLLLPLRRRWTGFLVMNRTFYAVTPELCADWVDKGLLYIEPTTGSFMTIGARFMPEQALHIGLFHGNTDLCLAFALQKGIEAGAAKLSCLFPSSAQEIQETLLARGFQLEPSDFIVMEVDS